MKITADEARFIAGFGSSPEEEVDLVFDLIREAANRKQRSLKLCNSDLWKIGGYSNSLEWRKACQLLRAVGFDTEYYFSEDQAAISYTLVRW